MTVVYLYDNKCNFNGILKALAILCLPGSWVVQMVLAPVCGDDGYIDCFKDCPLPNPGTFNHNAIFHIVYAAWLVFLAWAEDRSRGKAIAASNIDDYEE